MRISRHKQEFGIDLFARLVEKEDKEGWLPTDRQVRNMYDTARGDVQRIETTKQTKREEIRSLGGSSSGADGVGVTPTGGDNGENNNSSFTPPTTGTTFSDADPRSSMSTPGGFSDSLPQTSASTSNNNDGQVDLLLW